MAGMPAIPDSTKNSVTYRLAARARERWPQISRVNTRFRGGFGYVDAVLPDGEILRLCRLRYGGYANSWGFAIYRGQPRRLRGLLPAYRDPVGDRRRGPRHRLRPLPRRPHRLDLNPRRSNGNDH